MRRGAFTLVEMLAVVAVIGLLAGAVTWLSAGQAGRADGREAVSRIIHADRMARVEALRLGRPCSLRFDLDAQTVVAVSEDRRGRETAGRRVSLPANCRLQRVWIARSASGSDGDGPYIEKETGLAAADVRLSTAGRSATYAVKLAFEPGRGGKGAGGSGGAVWIVFCGITGQATCMNDDVETEKLLAAVVAARPDAH